MSTVDCMWSTSLINKCRDEDKDKDQDEDIDEDKDKDDDQDEDEDQDQDFYNHFKIIHRISAGVCY